MPPASGWFLSTFFFMRFILFCLFCWLLMSPPGVAQQGLKPYPARQTDVLLNTKSNLAGGNTFTGLQTVTGSVTATQTLSAQTVKAPYSVLVGPDAQTNTRLGIDVSEGWGLFRGNVNFFTNAVPNGGRGLALGWNYDGNTAANILYDQTAFGGDGIQFGKLNGSTITNQLILRGNGNVGISVYTPAERLDVSGTTLLDRLRFRTNSGTGNPTTGELTGTGQTLLWKNTTTGRWAWHVRDGATIQAVQPQNWGSVTGSGTGSVTSFTIPHGLGYTPTQYSITPATPAAGNYQYVTADNTNLTVFYTTAPALGTNNLIWKWFAQ
jgi:hypothetical protein